MLSSAGRLGRGDPSCIVWGVGGVGDEMRTLFSVSSEVVRVRAGAAAQLIECLPWVPPQAPHRPDVLTAYLPSPAEVTTGKVAGYPAA